MKTVAIIDAGGANLGSVQYAIARFGIQPRLVREASGLEGATHVILPGVGAAPVGMARLQAGRLAHETRLNAKTREGVLHRSQVSAAGIDNCYRLHKVPLVDGKP